MKSFDEYSQSFVVRFWVEPREIEDAPPVWRGMIEHVASGNRHYVKTLGEVAFLLASYLPDEKPRDSSRQILDDWSDN